MLRSIFLFASLTAALRSSTPYDSNPYSAYHARIAKRAANSTNNFYEVDLGYAKYEGYYDEELQANQWLGMRYAQPPVGALRWQPPRAPVPAGNSSQVLSADSYGTQCPAAPQAGSSYTAVNNAGKGEDCLYINVITPPNADNATKLPVMIWFHGGGYAAGSGGLDFTNLMHTNGDRFMVVTLNYRLGAFGFLSSDEVNVRGTPNAGLYDQQLALRWVQRYIHLFGGDPALVTIFGHSAGAGSVMLHDTAYGGTLGTSLFKNSITSSTYLPFQYGYKDWQPSQFYYSFAQAVGCNVGSGPIFDCLVEADEQTLIEANVNVSQSGNWGSFAFLPVTDGKMVLDRPSVMLAEGKINGINHLAGHSALEGAAWVEPESIETVEDFVDYVDTILPMFSNNDIARLLSTYGSNNDSTDFDAPVWATAGDSGPTHLNQSTAATGQQQRAIAVYGETTFMCPSYWLAEAYSDNKFGGQGWKYQWSVPNAYHGTDGAAYLRDPSDPAYYNFDVVSQPSTLYFDEILIPMLQTTAFQMMIGNFITRDDPTVTNAVANGITTNNETYNPVTDWPPYNLYDHIMVSLADPEITEQCHSQRRLELAS